MIENNKIALSAPASDKTDRYFTFRLKQNMYNEPSEYKAPHKIFAIADIEGNFNAFQKLLRKNKIIDSKYNWTFQDGHIVILGDCFDRGEHVIECLWLIYSLEEKARKEGGYVHFILGNHEIMNLNGDWRYIHPKYASSSKIPYTALYNGNNQLWHWLCTKNIIEKIGDVLFVHGGISKEILQLSLSATEINNLTRPYYKRANELFTDPLLHTIFNSENSPFWYRGYYQQIITEEQIDAILHHFNARTIVTGHTLVEKVSTFYNGKVINIDTDHAAGNSEALLIKKNVFFRFRSDGNKEMLHKQ